MAGYRLCAFADEASPAVDGQIEALKRNGLGLLEIRGVDGVNIADITLEKAKSVREKLDRAGIRVWSLGSPYGKINVKDGFKEHFDRFRHGLELCSVLGCERIRLFSFYVDGDTGDAVFDEVCGRLSRFSEEAEKAGIILCHENEKGIFGEKASLCLKLHKALPGIRAVFDPANFVQAGEDTVKAMGLLKPYVDYMHIKDALSGSGEIVPAGRGDGHIPELLKEFKEGVLTVEPHLRVFAGLGSLEQAGEKSNIGNAYGSSDEAFDAAVAAIKGLI
ncbi:MAG: sugar phosphate isomerase/epimerase [Clostridia bacterium]|nr:sugar phosphate isomerase/epimerase [Oscillospiraceae bacterium]MBQ7445622.1 sugar phosphate isomerase/epimerase [Clostridia bacterium]